MVTIILTSKTVKEKDEIKKYNNETYTPYIIIPAPKKLK